MLNVLYSLVEKSNINKQVRKALLINQWIWYMYNVCCALGVVAVNEVYCVMHLSLSLSLSLIAWGLLCWWWARCSSWWLWQSLSLQEPWLLQSDRPPSSTHPARWLSPGATVCGQRPALQEGAGDNPSAGLSDLPLLLCWVLLPHDEEIQGEGSKKNNVYCWWSLLLSV